MSIIELRGVARQVQIPDAPPLQILHSIDLSVDAGQHVAIVGRSGSGKSTLLNILGLLDLPSRGSMTFDGEPVSLMSSRRRDRLRGRNVGFVFQQFNLLEGLTAIENVMMPLMYGTSGQFWRREQLARQALIDVGLEHRIDSKPGTLSGGEQQRVAIARALVRGPRLLLADEPTGALDLETGRSIISMLDAAASERGAALIVITHDLGVAEQAQQIYRLNSGVLTADAVPKEVVA